MPANSVGNGTPKAGQNSKNMVGNTRPKQHSPNPSPQESSSPNPNSPISNDTILQSPTPTNPTTPTHTPKSVNQRLRPQTIGNQNYSILKSIENIKIIQINLQKARAADKNLINQKQADVILVQEPYTVKNVIHSTHRLNMFYDKSAEPPRSAILVNNPNWHPTLIYSSKDIIAISQSFINKTLIFVSVYADGHGILEDTLHTLDRLIDNNRGKHFIIGGDFNSWNKRWGYPENNTRGHKLAEYIDTKGLILQNTNKDPPTFEATTGKGWPDLTLTTTNISQYINNWHVSDTTSCSDHKNICMELNTETEQIINTRYNTNCRGNKFIRNIKNQLTRIESQIHSCNDKQDLEDITEYLITQIQEVCEVTFKIKTAKKSKQANWWTPELNTQKSKTRANKRRLKNETNPNTKETLKIVYKKELAKYKKQILETKFQKWNEFCTKNKTQYGILHKIITRKTFKPTNFTTLSTDNRSSQNIETILNTIADTLFLKDDPSKDTTEHKQVRDNYQDIDTPADQPITKKEIDYIVKNLPRHKAPGPDSIDNQIIKYLNTACPNLLHSLFNKCLQLHCFPKTLKIGQLTLFHKENKDPKLPDSYRPINLLPGIGKTLEKLLINRLRHSNIKNNISNPKQYGFKAGVSTEHAINDVIEEIKSYKNKKHVLLITLDLKGAFYSLCPVSSCPPCACDTSAPTSVCVPGELPVMKTLIPQATPPGCLSNQGQDGTTRPPSDTTGCLTATFCRPGATLGPCSGAIHPHCLPTWTQELPPFASPGRKLEPGLLPVPFPEGYLLQVRDPLSAPFPPETEPDPTPSPCDHGAAVNPAAPSLTTSSPPLDQDRSLVFSQPQAQKITLPQPTHVPGSPPCPDSPVTPPALLPVCPRTPSPPPATAPGVNTSWSLAFSPSQNQANPLLSFEATLELLLNETRPKGENVTTTPLKIPTPPPPTPRKRAPKWSPTQPHLSGA
ncbi:hypothetical protein JTE90_004053 [Oedothorax gibbosus]|uniref:Reverse transcriptase domain-containing protein n=1 Tax=Oedothorax gibbosus TaxID=931172 RepID=A0AAV6U6F7_9ARAC|nr:hypothetical protein JTE90_004053 [Oedothorax gibbosus]